MVHSCGWATGTFVSRHSSVSPSTVRAQLAPVGGAVVADAHPARGQPGEVAVVLTAGVLSADPHVDAAPGRLDERILHGGVAHLLAVHAQALGRAADEGEQLRLRVGGGPDQVAAVT